MRVVLYQLHRAQVLWGVQCVVWYESQLCRCCRRKMWLREANCLVSPPPTQNIKCKMLSTDEQTDIDIDILYMYNPFGPNIIFQSNGVRTADLNYLKVFVTLFVSNEYANFDNWQPSRGQWHNNARIVWLRQIFKWFSKCNEMQLYYFSGSGLCFII